MSTLAKGSIQPVSCPLIQNKHVTPMYFHRAPAKLATEN